MAVLKKSPNPGKAKFNSQPYQNHLSPLEKQNILHQDNRAHNQELEQSQHTTVMDTLNNCRLGDKIYMFSKVD